MFGLEIEERRRDEGVDVACARCSDLPFAPDSTSPDDRRLRPPIAIGDRYYVMTFGDMSSVCCDACMGALRQNIADREAAPLN